MFWQLRTQEGSRWRVLSGRLSPRPIQNHRKLLKFAANTTSHLSLRQEHGDGLRIELGVTANSRPSHTLEFEVDGHWNC